MQGGCQSAPRRRPPRAALFVHDSYCSWWPCGRMSAMARLDKAGVVGGGGVAQRIRRRGSGRKSTRRPKAQLPPRQTALIDPVHSQNGGRGHFVQSCVRTERPQWPFLKSSNNSQLIPASRKRLISVTAVCHRSNSSCCCALKSSSGLEGL